MADPEIKSQALEPLYRFTKTVLFIALGTYFFCVLIKYVIQLMN